MYCNYLYLFKLPSFVLMKKKNLSIVDNNVKRRKKTNMYCNLLFFKKKQNFAFWWVSLSTKQLSNYLIFESNL